MPGRKMNGGDYKYGFNGMESDNEIKGDGNSVDFGARMYDPRLGRWQALDPLARKYSSMSPYNFVANSPLLFIDPDGKRIKIYDPVTKKKHFYILNAKPPKDASPFVAGVYEALDYLLAKKGVGFNEDLGVNVLTKVISMKKTVNLMSGEMEHTGENKLLFEFNHVFNTIYFIPDLGMGIVGDDQENLGKTQSPALGLLHEISHAYNWHNKKSDYKRRSENTSLDYEDEDYHDEEEQYTVENVEIPAANLLTEPTRTNHLGADVRTKGASSREKVESAPKTSEKNESSNRSSSGVRLKHTPSNYVPVTKR